jgi:hypothetical protein
MLVITCHPLVICLQDNVRFAGRGRNRRAQCKQNDPPPTRAGNQALSKEDQCRAV